MTIPDEVEALLPEGYLRVSTQTGENVNVLIQRIEDMLIDLEEFLTSRVAEQGNEGEDGGAGDEDGTVFRNGSMELGMDGEGESVEDDWEGGDGENGEVGGDSDFGEIGQAVVVKESPASRHT